ncbi:MAG: type II secretion system secretin GspD [Bdellovibrionales bacterium]|nr:type II secretion system secretin GspD [Bdellovibrionales bacterium]
MTDTPGKRLVGIGLLLLSLGLHSAAYAEDNVNPFAGFGNNNEGKGPDTEARGEDDSFDELDDEFGFQPPSDLVPPPEGSAPAPRADVKPADPPPSRPEPRTPPPRTRTAPSRRNSPPPSLAKPSEPLAPLPGKKASAAPTGTKLAGYLELDPAVKGLQVKNFDLQDQDIRNVVKLISKWTGKNFILDQKVRGKITILGPSQVTLQEAYQAFLSSLAANGLTTVQSGKFIRVIESAEARRAPVKTYIGDYAPNTDQFITRIFQLRYINADEVQREFRDMTTRQGKLFAYEPTNSVIITDTGSNIQRIKDILDSLDIPAYETTLHVINIRHNSSKKIADLLDEIYGGGGSSNSRTSSNRRSFRRSQLERTRGGGVITKIVPDEQTNTLVVLANDRGFRQLKELVLKLDTKATDTGRVHVYYCEYAKAEDLAATLSALNGGGGAGASRTSRSRSSRTSSTPGATNTGSSSSSRSRSSASPVSAELDGGMRITSDISTNALVITGNAGDYQALKRVIKKLDIPRLQVFVESAIMELNLDDSTNIGLNYAFGHPDRLFGGGFIGDAAALTNILTGGSPPEGATIPLLRGNTFSNVPFSIGGVSGTTTTQGFMGLLNLLASTTQASILSTPQIIALDNEEAVFKVQDEIPVQGSATTTATGSTQNIERLKAGIEIKLTPFINAASGSIRLDIEQTVDSLKPATDVPSNLQATQRAKTTRETNTSVVVKDKDYVVLGGLMTDQVDEIAKKVPLLGDIPVLGWLFKSKSYRKVKKNLVVLLHPKIIGTTLEAANLVQDKLETRDRFIDEHLDGDEAHVDELNRIRDGIDRQKQRGRSAKVYNYRNNDDNRVDVDEPAPQKNVPISPTVPANPNKPATETEPESSVAPQSNSAAREAEKPELMDADLEDLISEEESLVAEKPAKAKPAQKPTQGTGTGIEPLPPEEGDFVTSPPNDPFFPSSGNPPALGPAGPSSDEEFFN